MNDTDVIPGIASITANYYDDQNHLGQLGQFNSGPYMSYPDQQMEDIKKAENESSTSVRAGLKKRARTGKAASSKDTANGTDINTNATQKVKAKRKKTSPKKPPQQKQRAKKVATRK